MLKRLFLLIFAALCGVAATAQDLIVKVDAVRIEARVTEITPDAVRYKRASNPDGPTYVLPVAQIDYIQYANGEKEYFGKTSASAPTAAVAPQTAPVAPQTPATPSAPASGQVAATAPAADHALPTERSAGRYVLKKYKVGDLYDVDGVKGVVCRVTEDGQHGLVLSLDQIMIRWSEFRKPDLRLTGAVDRTDGAVNMEKIAAYITANGLSWSDFPAFEWCRGKGDGWYLPAIDEMLSIGHNYNGGTRVRNDRQARMHFNETLKMNGGQRMDRLCFYFSSTETDAKSAYMTHMDMQPPYVIENPKSDKFLVRAVHKF